MNPNDIRTLLHFDPLAAAEDMTGQSYKDDSDTSALGFAIHLQHAKVKQAALESTGDTYFRMDYAQATAVYERLGFVKVATFPFIGSDDKSDELSLWWHADGLLLKAETYRTTGLNASTVFYNFRLREPRHPEAWSRLSSHGPIDGSDARTGSHDAREGLAANLAGLREVADLMPAWEEQPFLWLLTYMDTKDDDYDYKAITAERVAALPADVRAAVGDAR